MVVARLEINWSSINQLVMILNRSLIRRARTILLCSCPFIHILPPATGPIMKNELSGLPPSRMLPMCWSTTSIIAMAILASGDECCNWAYLASNRLGKVRLTEAIQVPSGTGRLLQTVCRLTMKEQRQRITTGFNYFITNPPSHSQVQMRQKLIGTIQDTKVQSPNTLEPLAFPLRSTMLINNSLAEVAGMFECQDVPTGIAVVSEKLYNLRNS